MLRLVLLRLLESYFRHRWLYMLPIVLMIVVAGLFVTLSPRKYTSGGVLFVQNDSLLSRLVPIGNSGFSWVTAATMTANELNELMRTEAFVRFIVQRTVLEEYINQGPDEAEETINMVRESVVVFADGEKLVRFGASHLEPEIAYQLALGTVEAYTEWKLNAERRESIVAQTFFAGQLEPLQEELQQARAELRNFIQNNPAPVRGERPEAEQMELDRLQSTVTEIADRVKETLENEEAARLALSKAESVANESYLVIDAPVLPRDPAVSKKDLIKTGIIFVVLGGVLSVIGVVGGMLLDRSIRFPIDVYHSLHLPVLSMVPDARPMPLADTSERTSPDQTRSTSRKPDAHSARKQPEATRETAEPDSIEQPAPVPTS